MTKIRSYYQTIRDIVSDAVAMDLDIDATAELLDDMIEFDVALLEAYDREIFEFLIKKIHARLTKRKARKADQITNKINGLIELGKDAVQRVN